MEITLIPIRLSTGRRPNSVVSGFVRRPNILGILEPVISASRIPVLYPWRASSTATSEVTEDLPTPPLPLITAITWPILLNLLGASFSMTFFSVDNQNPPHLFFYRNFPAKSSLKLKNRPGSSRFQSLPQDLPEGKDCFRSCTM